MAIRKLKDAEADNVAALAAVEPFLIANAEEAEALFDQIRQGKEKRTRGARYEKTLIHLKSNPNDRPALAAMALISDCTPVSWDYPEVRERAVLRAVDILEGREVPFILNL